MASQIPDYESQSEDENNNEEHFEAQAHTTTGTVARGGMWRSQSKGASRNGRDMVG